MTVRGEASAAAGWWRIAGLLGLVWWLGAHPGAAALPSATHAGDLARVERYLNALTTLKADFVQINPDGGTATGELYYQRPDKMRLDYDPPSDILIISDGWWVIYYDRRLEQVSHLTKGSTPLGFLLSDNIRLSGDVTVTDVVRSGGELYYQRPDKMRLDYDPPSDILIISDGWWVIYYDRRLEQVSHLTKGSTPLGFLLSDNIRLSGDVTVTDVVRSGGELHITLVQTDEPNQGSIELSFAEDPLELRRWTVVDAQGLATHVLLERPQTGVSLDRELFRFRNPKFYPDARN